MLRIGMILMRPTDSESHEVVFRVKRDSTLVSHEDEYCLVSLDACENNARKGRVGA